MNIQLPPIIKQSERLLLEIEQEVRRFARYHKYATGADLRTEAKQIVLAARQAWFDKDARAAWIHELALAIEKLKISMQLGMQLKAFTSFKMFEHLARQAEDLSRQARGWNDQVKHPKGQNSQAAILPTKRAKILSTHATSTGVNL